MNKEALEEVCRLAAEGCDEWSDMIDKLQAIQGKVGKAFAQMIEFMCQQGLIGRAHPFSLEELKSYYRYSHTERSHVDGICGYAETNDGKIYAVIVAQSINGMFVAARNIHMTDNKSFFVWRKHIRDRMAILESHSVRRRYEGGKMAWQSRLKNGFLLSTRR